jgi:hypothetical protein
MRTRPREIEGIQSLPEINRENSDLQEFFLPIDEIYSMLVRGGHGAALIKVRWQRSQSSAVSLALPPPSSNQPGPQRSGHKALSIITTSAFSLAL